MKHIIDSYREQNTRLIKVVATCLLLGQFQVATADEGIERNLIVVFGDHDRRKEAGIHFAELLQNSEEPLVVSMFDADHTNLGSIRIENTFPDRPKVFWRRYGRELQEALFVLKQPMSPSKAYSFLEHMDFIEERLRIADSPSDVLLYDTVLDERLLQISQEFPEENVAYLANVENNPYAQIVSDLSKSAIHIHLQRDDKGAALKNRDLCALVYQVVQKANGVLGSCQSSPVWDRLWKPSAYYVQDHLPEKDDAFDGLQFLDTGDFRIVQSNGVQVARTSHDRQFGPVGLSLTWFGESDMDLSVWSDEERLHFGSRTASFGSFSQAGNIEQIYLLRVPERAQLRIVHSGGIPPSSLRLTVESDGTHEESNLDGLFSRRAHPRTEERVLMVDLWKFLKSPDDTLGEIRRKLPR